jgi:UDP-N-acetylmuramyl pentapeptide phosphotransferase/UDP-N-acetylglucosamine-1-phosphate transferase
MIFFPAPGVGVVILLVVASMLISAGLTVLFSREGSPLHILDHPNDRSLHERPMPRSGGPAMVLAIFIAGGVAGMAGPLMGSAPGLLPGFALVAGISFLEDRWGIPPQIRLLVHFGAALLLVRGGLTLATLQVPGLDIEWPLWLATLATVLYVTWMANLYNFMDGIDGLASGAAVIGFCTFAVLGYRAGDPLFMLASLVVAAAAAGFLLFNFAPARCFMGDTGSLTLGFLVAGFTLWGSYQWIIPIWISVLVFSPFIVDATATLLRRVARRERFWEPHRTHYYQRVVRLGWSHRRTVLVEYVLMGVCASAAALALRAPVPARWAILAAAALTYAILIFAIRRAERRGAGAAVAPDRRPSPPLTDPSRGPAGIEG